jgi:16S rRNA (cytosine1402-N4)-methyltransferase
VADLGVSSMQIDDPSRGFSTKQEGPLDMRMNPARGQSASALLRGINSAKLARLLEENSDEPHSERLAAALAGKSFPTTLSLASAIRTELSRVSEEAVELTIRRVFQALRIEVNDEFSALDSLLRQLPSCLNPGGRAAILTFHSGEDRRVKKSFAACRDAGLYSQISNEVIRPSAAERNANPRSSSAKLRWIRRSL